MATVLRLVLGAAIVTVILLGGKAASLLVLKAEVVVALAVQIHPELLGASDLLLRGLGGNLLGAEDLTQGLEVVVGAARGLADLVDIEEIDPSRQRRGRNFLFQISLAASPP